MFQKPEFTLVSELKVGILLEKATELVFIYYIYKIGTYDFIVS